MVPSTLAHPRAARGAPSPGAVPYEGSSGEFEILLVRSARRKKTVSARLLNWYTMEVVAPTTIPDNQLRRMIDSFVAQFAAKRNAQRHFSSEEGLEERAQALNRLCFDGQLKWRSIRYVTNQNSCFGSCSPGKGTIRISHRLAGVPEFVRDYVIVHELAHFLEGNHSKAFWELVNRYPKTERARGYLMALGMEDDLMPGQDGADEGE